MTNPLLETDTLPAFDRIKPEHVEPAIDYLLQDNRAQIEHLIKDNQEYTWDNAIQPLENLDDRLNRAWSPASHLHSVADNDDLRKAYNNCLPKLSDYATEMGQNEDLYRIYKAIADGDEYNGLEQAQKKIIENALRDFRLTGIELNDEEKKQFKQIQQELTKLQTKFEENILDATQTWKKHITDENRLKGLPDSTKALVRQNAEQEDLPGWLLNLDFPCYLPVMQYVEDTELRREMYEAYVTRASDQGPNAGQWDNSDIMLQILKQRHEKAQLLNYDNYAYLSLAKKMARDTDEVMGFLLDLARRSKPVAERDFNELKSFAKENYGLDEVNAWDVTFYSERLKEHKFHLSAQELRPYFPVPQVLAGLFEIVNRLYALNIKQRDGVSAWHPDVQFFDIHDQDGQLRGSFYLDLYSRKHKRGGAWMDECIVRKKIHHGIQTPVAYLTCNFTPPVGNEPSLLTHDEVLTLFHEFGHGLHHMLTKVDYAGVSGINGVPWDAVELPSQFMENWCWEREALDLIGRHYQTGQPIGEDLFSKMQAAKNFQSGMQMVRQLEFALFDFRLHQEYQPDTKVDIQALLDSVRQEVAVVHPPKYNRFQHSFSHIFAGGYAAGYYSYKWAEVLSADAFSKFEEQGIFNRHTGDEFLHNILEQGGSCDPMDLFIKFRGRKPSVEPLLRHSGIAA